jgi:PAS domain S-box-containing protein
MMRLFQNRWALALTMMMVGGLVIGIGIIAVRDLRVANHQTRQMYSALALELDRIGEMQYQAQETRRSSLYALTTTDSNLQVRYADQSRAADALVSEKIAEHIRTAPSRQEVEAGERLKRDWAMYLQVRDEVIGSILAGSIDEAVTMDLQGGVPSFDKVRDDLRSLNQLYKQRAERQLAEVEAASNRLLWKVILILCLTQLFLAGFAVMFQRGKMQRLLVESGARLRQVIESIHEGMLVITRDGRVTICNQATERIFGRTRKQFVGRPLFEAVPEFWGSALPAALSKALQDGRSDLLQDLNFTGALADHTFEARLFPFEGGATVFLRDVSERKALENQLRQAQKMEAVGRLAGGVAHDFNNLLMVIQGFSELLLERLDNTQPMYRSAEEIKKAAQRAASLTRQLLAFSRMQVLDPKALNLNAVLTDMCKMLPRLIGEHIELTIHCEPSLGSVKADKSQLEQVILNLAVNARDAMPEGGKLIIETTNLRLDAEYARRYPDVRPGKYVMLSVTDTGAGMDSETRAHIFEPFFTTKELGRGTGLGLATVYGVVKQSGGWIWVYSEPGQGTTFKIYLPQIDGAIESDKLQETPEAAPRGTETILVVEDQDEIRQLTCDLLESKGYTVLRANNGVEALHKVECHPGPIHLLITDVMMPKMGGRELVSRLSAMRPEIKVIYMSGYAEYAVAEQDLVGPDRTILQKPFSLNILAGKVRDVLAGKVVGLPTA